MYKPPSARKAVGRVVAIDDAAEAFEISSYGRVLARTGRDMLSGH